MCSGISAGADADLALIGRVLMRPDVITSREEAEGSGGGYRARSRPFGFTSAPDFVHAMRGRNDTRPSPAALMARDGERPQAVGAHVAHRVAGRDRGRVPMPARIPRRPGRKAAGLRCGESDREAGAAMCRGPGRIQQEITALIAANPDDAWTLGELCGLIYYGQRSCSPTPEKKHRVAVTRALRQMELPPLWRTVRLNRSGAEHCLYNTGSLESTKRKYHLAGWPLDSVCLIEHVPKEVAEARRYHEAPPVEKIDIDNAGADPTMVPAVGGLA
jgi:hypothetical protein